MTYRRSRAQRHPAAGHLARAVAQLRRRPAAGDPARDPAPRVRPRHHPLRPGQQLRPALRLGRGELRPDLRRATSARTATSCSSRPRPATTCGPVPTASAARASTCSPAWTSRWRGWAWTTSTSSTPTASTRTPRSRRRWARSTRPCAPARRSTPASRPTRPNAPPRRRAILRELGTPLLIHQPSYSMLNRWIEGGLLDTLGRGRRRLHRVLAAGPGHADARYLDGMPEGSRMAARTSLSARPADRAEPGPHPGAERARGPARPDAGAAGAGLGAARPAGHVGADRRVQRRAARGQRRPRWTTSTFTADELAEIDRYAVEGGINLWRAAATRDRAAVGGSLDRSSRARRARRLVLVAMVLTGPDDAHRGHQCRAQCSTISSTACTSAAASPGSSPRCP